MREKYQNLWGLWVRAHAIIKNEGSLGDSDAEKGGLLSLTYASPPEWDCPPGLFYFILFYFILFIHSARHDIKHEAY